MGLSFITEPSLQNIHYDIFPLCHRYRVEHGGYQNEETNEYVAETNYYVDYTSYVLFVNGNIIINPTIKSLLEYEQTTLGDCDGSFNEDLLAYIIPGKKSATKRFSEPINFKIYDRNKDGYLRLLELKKQEKRKTISTQKRLNAIEYILNEFIQWFENEGLISQLESDLAITDNQNNSNISKQLLVPAEPAVNIVTNDILSNSQGREPFIWLGNKSKLKKLLKKLMEFKFISSVRKINENFEPVTKSIDVIMNTHFSYPSKPEGCEVDNNHFIKWKRPQDEVGYLFSELLFKPKLISLDKIYLMIEYHFINKKNNPFDHERLCSAYSWGLSPIRTVKGQSDLSKKLENKKMWMKKLENIVDEL